MIHLSKCYGLSQKICIDEQIVLHPLPSTYSNIGLKAIAMYKHPARVFGNQGIRAELSAVLQHLYNTFGTSEHLLLKLSISMTAMLNH